MTLATIRTHHLKAGSDLVIMYRYKLRSPVSADYESDPGSCISPPWIAMNDCSCVMLPMMVVPAYTDVILETSLLLGVFGGRIRRKKKTNRKNQYFISKTRNDFHIHSS